MNSATRIVLIVFVGLAGAGAFLWWARPRTPPPPPPRTVAQPAPPAKPPAPAPPAVPPAVRHPIASAAGATGALPGLDQADALVKNALVDLLGRRAVLTFLGVDGFVRRLVATTDNLTSDNAPADLWPVKRTAGHVETETRADGGTVISPRNAGRYAPFVQFVDGIDARRAVILYVRLYPLFQRAYEDLGHPGEYFNDRAVAVIDHLLATPDVPQPPAVKLVKVEGAAAPERGGGLYVFDDATIESTQSAGQKILLRIGRENAARLKAKLAEVRRLIVAAAGTQPR